MGLITSDADNVALVDSVSGYAFGPTFPSEEAARHFIDWTIQTERPDPRTMRPDVLSEVYEIWGREHGAQFDLYFPPPK